MRTLTFTVDEAYEDKKLLSFLKTRGGLSSRLIGKLKKEENGMLCNGVRCRTVDRVHKGDTVEINIPDESTSSVPGDFPLDIIYEDDDILVINKPAGLAMHETHNHVGDTLANAVAGYLIKNGKGGPFRAVGRLDKDTSGIVVCALHSFGASVLSGNIKKTYLALVDKKYTGCGVIDVPIYRPDPMKTLRACGLYGEKAVTKWECIASDGNASLLKIQLETGRTHQIRVHFSYIGSPLMGDDMYGGSLKKIGRHALHCCRVEFLHPVTKKKTVFDAPLPQDMKAITDGLDYTDKEETG